MTTNNWPDPARPGFPMFPERDGWHWLSNRPNDAPFPAEWSHEEYYDAEAEWFWDMGEEKEDAHEMRTLYYHGPILTPDQIKEMRMEERERCAKAISILIEEEKQTYGEEARDILWALRKAHHEIHNLGDAP